METHILGGGHVGLSIADACLEAGIPGNTIRIIDRNSPFDIAPLMQTSANAIGIIEPSGLKPARLMYDCYLQTREHYQQLIAKGVDYVEATPVSYFSNEDGFLDGPDGRAPDENHIVLSGEELLGFRYGERFDGIFVNTTIANWTAREALIAAGVEFVTEEVDGRPEDYRLRGKDSSLLFDCRGLGLKETEIGSTLFPVAGQTFLLHAPEGTEFDGIVGHPGSQMSYNVVPWMKVTLANLRMLGLENKIDATKGGWLVLIGASKRAHDYNWEPQTWELESFLAGAAKLDPRVHEWTPVLARKGERAKEPRGILYQVRLLPPEKAFITLTGLAGNAYCVMYGLSRVVVSQALRTAQPADGLGLKNWG